MNLSKNLSDNVNKLKEKLLSDDITFLEMTLGEHSATLIFANELVSKENVGGYRQRRLWRENRLESFSRGLNSLSIYEKTIGKIAPLRSPEDGGCKLTVNKKRKSMG